MRPYCPTSSPRRLRGDLDFVLVHSAVGRRILELPVSATRRASALFDQLHVFGAVGPVAARQVHLNGTCTMTISIPDQEQERSSVLIAYRLRRLSGVLYSEELFLEQYLTTDAGTPPVRGG